MNEVQVRKASSDDIEAARALTNRSWLTTYAPLIGEDTTRGIIETRYAAPLFAQQAENPDDTFLVAARDGQIVGHCYAYPKKGTYIDRLHVEPDLKGGGIGRAMLDHVEAQHEPGSRIWLEVLQGNDNAIAFYERTGFTFVQQAGEDDGVAGVPALIYCKTLNEKDIEPTRRTYDQA
ncbi:MAG: GNAT family N-acetyltransferase [Pseudomonadota bacterium]